MSEPSMSDIVKRLTALEQHQRELDELIDLLQEVRSALRVFVHLGNAFKWVVGLGAAIAAAFYAIRKALQ